MSRQRGGDSLRLVHITDTHLYRSRDEQLLGLNTEDSFEAVLKLVRERESDIDMILATGDIAQDGSLEAYRRFGHAMEQQLQAPFYWIPGNHDKPVVMSRAIEFPDAFRKCIRAGNWQVIMLDTCVPGAVHGHLDDTELEHLEQSLQIAAAADASIRHSLVCLHHNPFPGTAAWMEGIGLDNAGALFSLLERYDSVRAVVFGHIHQDLDFLNNGIRYFCSPSTCIQFKPGATDFTLDATNPAYRWLELQSDGRIDSGVERVRGFAEKADSSASGY